MAFHLMTGSIFLYIKALIYGIMLLFLLSKLIDKILIFFHTKSVRSKADKADLEFDKKREEIYRKWCMEIKKTNTPIDFDTYCQQINEKATKKGQ